ncbi:hypothetical protein [Streptomyces nigrescens]
MPLTSAEKNVWSSSVVEIMSPAAEIQETLKRVTSATFHWPACSYR